MAGKGMGKVKALQIWCKNRCIGYKDVSIDNMTTSWRDGLAFCALIHKFRPDLVDFDSLSKENVYDNNALAFEVAQNSLSVPALLDAEDMVRLATPDKLSIITYVAQLHNAFKDMEPVGGPTVKVPVKRQPIYRSNTISSPDTKRKIVDKENQTNTKKSYEPISGTISPTSDICVQCDGKVYLIEKYVVDGKMYHRSCYRDSNKAKSHAQSSPALNIHHMKPASDNIPDWQKNLKRRSAGAINLNSPRLSSMVQEDKPASSSQLQPMHQSKTPQTEVKVEMRSPLRNVSKPRPISSAIDMADGLDKLRRLREQAKSQRSGSPTIKERLQKLRNLAAEHDSSPSPSRPKKAESPLADRPRITLGAIDETTCTNTTVASTDNDAKTDDDKSSELASKTQNPSLEMQPDSQFGAITDEKLNIVPSPNTEVDVCVNQTSKDHPPSDELVIMEVDSDSEKSSDLNPVNLKVQTYVRGSKSGSLVEPNGSEHTYQVEDAAGDKSSLTDSNMDSFNENTSLQDNSSEKTIHDKETANIDVTLPESHSPVNTASTDFTVTESPKMDTVDESSTKDVSRKVDSDRQAAKVLTGTEPVPTTSSITASVGLSNPVAPMRTKHVSSVKVLKSNEDIKPSHKPSAAPPRTTSAVSIRTPAAALTTSTQRGTVDSISIETNMCENTHDPSKSPKPPRPAGPPPSQTPNKTLIANKSPVYTKSSSAQKSTPSRPEPPVEMRVNHENRPPRPVTTATGSPSSGSPSSGSARRSQFYMDNSHENVVNPPTKPVRSSGATKISQAKNGWQDSLDNWSSKRKNRPATTWYSADEYPDENNPFAEDTDVQPAENTSNTQTDVLLENGHYNDALNPFADENLEEDVTPGINSTVDESINPFGKSDGGTEETKNQINTSTNPFGEETPEDEDLAPLAISPKKIIPANPFSADSDSESEQTTLKKDSKRGKNPQMLPTTVHQKKKAAPAPPSIAPLKKQKSLEDLNSTTPSVNTRGEDNSKDVVKRKTKTAPPRPMPPKRRVCSGFGYDETDVTHEMSEIEEKQKELEEQGRRLERAIRHADDERAVIASSQETVSSQEDDLISQWLETVNQKNELLRREQELMFIVKHQELETVQADIEWQLRQIMHKAENLKTDDEKAEEEELIQQLVTIVTERSKLVDKMDAERMRHEEEDEEINSMLEEKQLTPSVQTSGTNASGKKNKKKKEPKKKDKGKKNLFA